MSEWKPSSSVQQKYFYDWFLHHKLLVKIYHVGQYLILFNEKGTPDNEVPHIEVLLDGDTEDGKFYYTNTTVRVYSPKKNRSSITMTIWKSGPQPKSLSPDILINLAKTQLNDAENTLTNMTTMFKNAKKRVKEARAYETIFSTREDYEKACATLGVEALSDQLCRSYRIQFGEFKFPDFSGDHCLTMKLARRRSRGLVKENVTNIKEEKSVPVAKEQQWEACKICGNEPRYQPLLVCEKCWPKS